MGINLYIENLEIPAKMPLKIFFLDLAYGIIGPRRVPIFSWLTSQLAFGFIQFSLFQVARVVMIRS
jgi:hypothetical protein